MQRKINEEQEQERINRLYYEEVIDKGGGVETLLKALTNELDYLINYSTYLPNLKENRPDIYDDLKEWFKNPDTMNAACNILKVIDELYDVDEDEKTGLLSYIFDNYEIKAYIMLPDSTQRRSYSRLETKRELKARKFKKLDKITFKPGYYVGNHDIGVYYPKPFTEDEKDRALFQWGLNCRVTESSELEKLFNEKFEG